MKFYNNVGVLVSVDAVAEVRSDDRCLTSCSHAESEDGARRGSSPLGFPSSPGILPRFHPTRHLSSHNKLASVQIELQSSHIRPLFSHTAFHASESLSCCFRWRNSKDLLQQFELCLPQLFKVVLSGVWRLNWIGTPDHLVGIRC